MTGPGRWAWMTSRPLRRMPRWRAPPRRRRRHRGRGSFRPGFPGRRRGRDGSGRRLPEPIANQGMGPCRQTTGVRRSIGSCASASAFDGGREWLDPPAVGSSRQGNLTSRPKPHRVDAGWQCAVCRTPIAGLASVVAPCASWAGVGGAARWLIGWSPVMTQDFSVWYPDCPVRPAVARTATLSSIPRAAVAVSGIVYGL
jgi:hypothetical protein